MHLPNLTQVVANDATRPSLQYAYFTDKYLYATDGWVAVRITISNLTAEDEDYSDLTYKCFDIEALTLLKKPYERIEIKKAGLLCYPKKGKPQLIRYTGAALDADRLNRYYLADLEEEIHLQGEEINMPNIDSIISRGEIKYESAVSYVGMDIDNLVKLRTAFLYKPKFCHMVFTQTSEGSTTRPIRLIPFDGVEADEDNIYILMPTNPKAFNPFK